jgi:hypothetical protein
VGPGLDKDDTAVRRRLRQELEFMSDGIAALTEPTEADWAAYLPLPARQAQHPRGLTVPQPLLDPPLDHATRSSSS